MVRLADRELGEPRTSSWLRSMIRHGWLSSPRVHGIPDQRGGRAPGTWTDADRRLFKRVLEAMRHGADRAELCDVVALAWLDDTDGCVQLRQLRRALRTYRDMSWSQRANRQAVSRLADHLARGPGMSRAARSRFIDAFQHALRDGAIDPDALTWAAFDPDGVGPPPWRGAISPTGVIVMLRAWQAGCHHIDRVDDDALETAREPCRTILQALSATPQTSAASQHACASVLLTLGVLTPELPGSEPSARAPRHGPPGGRRRG
jgi:hypothetical protein